MNKKLENILRRVFNGWPYCPYHYFYIIDIVDFGNKFVSDFHYKVECEYCGKRKWIRERELIRRHNMRLLQVHNYEEYFGDK